MAGWWEVIDLGGFEQMVRYQSYSHWGMIEIYRTEVYKQRRDWLGAGIAA